MGSSEDEGGAATAMAATALHETAQVSRLSRPAIEGFAPGAMLGRYKLVARLGAGAMGVVWSAHDPQLDRIVAIKLLHPHMGDTPEAAARLLREARAMAKLSHRNVITVHDAGDVDGHLFIAMELIEGTTLGALLRARAPGAPADWRRWFAILVEAGQGLAAAHARGVLHRDFKPDNVLVDRNERACVGDFGVALVGEPDPKRAASQPVALVASDLTQTGALIGTPLYMSPQQLRGETIDARADQFAFCVTAWEALYGERPFPVSGSLYEAMGPLLEMIERGALPPAPATSPVPAAIRDVLARGLAPEPSARWPELTQLLAALEAAVRPRRARRWPLVLAAVGGAGVICAAGIAAVTLRSPDRGQREPVHMFNVALGGSLALSPDGKLLALDNEALEVRSLDGSGAMFTLGLNGKRVSNLELDHDSLRFTLVDTHSVMRWDFATTGAVTTVMEDVGGRWDGTTAFGALVYRTRQGELAIVDGTTQRQAWKTSQPVDVVAISPDRTRVAYLQSTRYRGTIVVKDLTTGREIASPHLPEPTALAWLDDDTLLYATGTSFQPTLYRVPVDDSGFGPPTAIFQRPLGWFGHLAARGATVLLTEMRPTSRAKVFDRAATPMSSRELDTSRVGAALAWVSSTAYLTWNPNTRSVDQRSTTGDVTRTSISLPGEPAGATVADGTLIVATRDSGGRRLQGHDLATGRLLWTGPDLDTIAVRCAADHRPPCFAIRSGESVVQFDPTTGRPGDLVYQRHEQHASIEDLAVREDGTQLVIAGNRMSLLVLSSSGEQLDSIATPLKIVRSVALDPQGGLLVSGTGDRARFQFGTIRDGYDLLAQSDNEQFSLVRPSPDGRHVLVLARQFSPTLSRLDLPSR
ncbi:MAG: LpqB family beta-propeller domain-containing protein [Kofleriaceae bacterium]|nr:LpqB family beta-propeller domain-containing protein [Kofleriaceae bacterium]